MKDVGSNHRTAAAWNRTLTVRLLRQHGTLSRQDISRMTRLRGSTLTYIVRELLEKNIVRVVGKRQSTQVGPKEVLLTLNPDLGQVLGVALRPEFASLVLLDAAGGSLGNLQVPISGPLETVPAQLAEAVSRWTKQLGLPARKLLRVGVGVAGVVDADAGVVLRSIPFNAVNLPLKQLLIEQFDAPAEVDHDACYGAYAEATGGAAADASHFIYFSINTTGTASRRLAAYGSALYLGGNVYRGAFYGAGELSDVLEPGPLDLSDDDMTALLDPEGPMPPALIDLAGNIGRSLGTIINVIDVQMVILAGTVRIANRRFIAAVQAEVTRRLVNIPGRAVRVVRSAWEPNGIARGAAISALDALIARGGLFDDKAEVPAVPEPA